jgi:hypothetical protein
MTWTAPRTWYANETITSEILNQHLRDQMNVLKTNVDSVGHWKTELGAIGFTAGTGNPAGGVLTVIPAYDVTIPAGFLAQPGDILEVNTTLATSATAGTKTFGLSIGTGAAATIVSTTFVSMVWLVKIQLTFRTAVVIAAHGLIPEAAHLGAANCSMCSTTITPGASVTTTTQALRCWLGATAANEIMLAEHNVNQLRSLVGATV